MSNWNGLRKADDVEMISPSKTIILSKLIYIYRSVHIQVVFGSSRD